MVYAYGISSPVNAVKPTAQRQFKKKKKKAMVSVYAYCIFTRSAYSYRTHIDQSDRACLALRSLQAL